MSNQDLEIILVLFGLGYLIQKSRQVSEAATSYLAGTHPAMTEYTKWKFFRPRPIIRMLGEEPREY